MRLALAVAFACAALFAATDGALAQAKKSGMTCAQRCSAYCNSGGKHHNCFDRCSTTRCAGK